MTKPQNTAHAPETVEGWYALHQVFRNTGRPYREGDAVKLGISSERLESHPDGWTGWVELIGSRADVMLMHFYPALEGIRVDLLRLHGGFDFTAQLGAVLDLGVRGSDDRAQLHAAAGARIPVGF